MNPLDKLLVASTIALRLLDAQSTHSMLQRGYHEEVLPASIATNQGAMYAFSMAAGVIEAGVAIELTHHDHRRLARGIMAAGMGATVGVIVHNDGLKAVKK
jgi:hypothetical protein